MHRRTLRTHHFQMVFCMDFHKKEDIDEQIEMHTQFMQNNNTLDEDIESTVEPISEKQLEQLVLKSKAIASTLETLDKDIEAASSGWSLKRLGRVELAILRLAYYEMKFDDDVPIKVAINEAVELAKQYGGDESASFVNAILAKLV